MTMVSVKQLQLELQVDRPIAVKVMLMFCQISCQVVIVVLGQPTFSSQSLLLQSIKGMQCCRYV